MGHALSKKSSISQPLRAPSAVTTVGGNWWNFLFYTCSLSIYSSAWYQLMLTLTMLIIQFSETFIAYYGISSPLWWP